MLPTLENLKKVELLQSTDRSSCSIVSGDINCHSFLSHVHISVQPSNFFIGKKQQKQDGGSKLENHKCVLMGLLTIKL